MKPGGMADVAVDKAFNVGMTLLAPIIWGCIVIYDKVKPFFKKKTTK